MKLFIKICLVATSLFAALAWLRAATVKAAPLNEPDYKWVQGAFSDRDGRQMIADGKIQQRRNSIAAGFATAAAFFTALDAFFSP